MDDPLLDERAHVHALRGLARLNAVSRTAQALAHPIRRLARTRQLRPVRILDVACGAGDVATRLQATLTRAGVPVEVAGCDLSHLAVRHASCDGSPVRFFQLDALNDPLPDDYDVITCNLFLHHLGKEDALHLLTRLGHATRHLLLVSDLVRSRWNLALTYAATRVLTRSPVVHFDGPVSVRAAYTLAEARDLAEAAGLAGFTLRRHWAARFTLAWERPHAG